jgi:hypothetical protein
MNLNKHNHFTLRITRVFTQLLRQCLEQEAKQEKLGH